MSCRHGDRGLQVWVQRKGFRLEFKKHFSKTPAHLKPVSHFCSLRLHLATWFVLLGRVQTFSFLFLHAEEGSACLIYSWRSDLVNTQQRSACEQDSAVHALEHNHVQTLVKGNRVCRQSEIPELGRFKRDLLRWKLTLRKGARAGRKGRYQVSPSRL